MYLAQYPANRKLRDSVVAVRFAVRRRHRRNIHTHRVTSSTPITCVQTRTPSTAPHPGHRVIDLYIYIYICVCLTLKSVVDHST